MEPFATRKMLNSIMKGYILRVHVCHFLSCYTLQKWMPSRKNKHNTAENTAQDLKNIAFPTLRAVWQSNNVIIGLKLYLHKDNEGLMICFNFSGTPSKGGGY